MNASHFRIVGPVLLVGFLAACDGSPEASSSASAPAHPAMHEPVGRSAPASAAGRGPGGLPPDHPPISRGGGGMEERGPPGIPGPAEGAGVEERLASMGLACKLPEGWVEEPPSNDKRLGQARLPRAAGDTEDGEVAISFAGGTLDANVKRWSDQFTEKPQPLVQERKVGDFQVALVELEGSFTAGGPMMKSAGGAKPGTKLIGAIVSIPGSQQMIFFKAWGPKATMDQWKPSFEELASSFRPAR